MFGDQRLQMGDNRYDELTVAKINHLRPVQTKRRLEDELHHVPKNIFHYY